MNLTEAFKVLDSLTEDTFDLDQAGIAKLSDFEDDNFQDNTIMVIDAKANTEDELKNSYVGKVILDCQVCHSKQYKDKEDVVLDDTHTLANVGEECPYCYASDGFKVIGEVVEFPAEEEKDEEQNKKLDNEVSRLKKEYGINEKLMTSKHIKKAIKKSKSIKESNDKFIIKFDNMNGSRRAFISKNAPTDPDDKLFTDVDSWFTYNKKDAMIFDSYSDAKHFWNEFVVGIPLIADDDNTWYMKDCIVEYNAESKSIKESIRGDIYSAVNKHFNYNVTSEFAELITHLVDRALLENPEDIGEKIEFAIDEGLIYNKDIWTIKEFYEEAALDDSTYEELFNDMYSIINSIKDYEDLEEKCLNEDIKDISITTDDTHMSMSTEENGKVVVTSEPVEKESCEKCKEVIKPISDETKDEIEAEDEVEGEDDMIDFDIDEFDEKSFDELGERYLKKVYENVNSFKCTNVSTKKDKLIVEGKVNFASGKVSPTRFVFEACSATKDGRVSFVGHNKNITRGNKAFTLNGIVKDKNLIAESFKYNYMSKNPEGKSSRIYGTIKKI